MILNDPYIKYTYVQINCIWFLIILGIIRSWWFSWNSRGTGTRW